ncbi:MAG TPA: TolC family protein, partial [Planctomycetaceae bacterium]|nr:TolC family protein [Planctomycetaceae bacterium]
YESTAREGYDDEDRSLTQRLQLPKEVPGAGVPPLSLPERDPNDLTPRNEAIDRLFPELPAPTRIAPTPPAGRQRMSLDAIKELALQNSPILQQAQADIESAIGTAVQSGTHPNPIVGYEADTVNSLGSRNYQGVFFTQLIKTGGKLELARAADNVALMNRQVALRRSRFDLLARTQANYFQVLVAQETLRATEAFVRFSNEVYRVQVDQLKGGEVNAYEPMQLRAFALQARSAYASAQNRYISAWKQMAATIGVPDLPPTPLEGQADMPVPKINYQLALAHALDHHTDVITAVNMQSEARLRLRLAEITPIPDISLYATFQRDFTAPGTPRTTYNTQVGMPIPVWDRNKGGIQNAQGMLMRAIEELRRSRNDLTTRMADAYERFESNRILVEYYDSQILPDLTRAYRAIYLAHQGDPEKVGFNDIVVAQQNLSAGVNAYLTALSAQWLALADLMSLVQVEHMEELTPDSLMSQEGPGAPPDELDVPPAAPPADQP